MSTADTNSYVTAGRPYVLVVMAYKDRDTQADNPQKSYVVASPKYPGKNSRLQGQVYDSRTFGDHVGILGVIAGFGSLYGDTKNIELISAQHAPKDLLKGDINLFLIGSPKVNRLAEEILRLMSGNSPMRWKFARADGIGESEHGDWPVAQYQKERLATKNRTLNLKSQSYRLIDRSGSSELYLPTQEVERS